jgi:hypothetical protein
MKGNNIAVSDGNQRNFNKNSIIPYIEYFCRNNRYDDPKSCAEGLFNFIKDLGQNIRAEYHVCGYNPVVKIPLPEFWYVDVAKNTVFNAIGEVQYGICFCGVNEYFPRYAPLINQQPRLKSN